MKVLSKVHTKLENMGYVEDIVEEGFQWTKEVEDVRVTMHTPSKGMVLKYYHSLPVTLKLKDANDDQVVFNFDNLDTALKLSDAVFHSFEAFGHRDLLGG